MRRIGIADFALSEAIPIDSKSGPVAAAASRFAHRLLTIAVDQYRVSPYAIGMSHTIKEKSKLISRVRRIKGQLEAVERALESEIGCADVLMLVASVRGAVSGLTSELIEDHIRHHVVNPAQEKDPEKAKGAADLIDVVRTYLK